MSLDRKRKLQRRKQKQQRADAVRRDRLRDALMLFGLHEFFDAIPSHLQAQIAGFALPAPTLTLDPSAARLEAGRRVERWFQQLVFTPWEVARTDPFAPSFYEVFSILDGLHSAPWHRLIPAAGKHGSKARLAVHNFLEHFMHFVEEGAMDIRTRAMVELLDELASQSSATGHYLYLRADLLARGARSGWKFDVHALEAERRHVSLDGVARPVYRCYGVSEGLAPPAKLSWSPKEIGFSDATERLPVFIQSHAEDACRKRLPTGIFHVHTLSQSLEEPEVERLYDDARLIAYRIGANRYGYFVCRLAEEGFVLQTFLFLTMEGTPEHRRLREKLRLRRRDIEELKLDDLDRIIFSDLRDDPELAKTLGECGLSHLLVEHAGLFSHVAYPGVAQTVRKYLGMPQATEGQPAPPPGPTEYF